MSDTGSLIMSSTRVLVDGDIILYRACLACETQHYNVFYKDMEEYGPINEEPFRYKKEADNWIQKQTDKEDKIALPFGISSSELKVALYNIKSMLASIEDELGSVPDVFIGGKDNFRKKISGDYKAGRNRRPIFLDDAKEYMVKKHGATIVDGMETDDMLGIEQDPNSIIASIDKDLLMIPGEHYHIVKKEFTVVTQEEGMQTFLKQVISGDRVDNIPGIPGMGPATIAKLGQLEPQDVADLYEDHYGELIAEAILDKTAKLIWIMRNKSDIELSKFKDITERYWL